MFSRKTIIAACAFIAIGLFYLGCASYNQQASFYEPLQEGDYSTAAKQIDNNKLLSKKRNRLLFLLERGKVSHLLNDWEKSNLYLNEADNHLEAQHRSLKDVAVGTLINPMMQDYKPEAFEKYLIHYYKALNYLQLSQPEEALVEARRISLALYAEQDKAGDKQGGEDAFALMLQGLIYEQSNDYNNAFIAYRNATDVFMQRQQPGEYQSMPLQLKKDLLRTASLMGFADELARYENLFSLTYTDEIKASGGELIIFWENGAAPVKAQRNLFFSLIKNGDTYLFNDANGLFSIPYHHSKSNELKLENFRSFRVAVPELVPQPEHFSSASVSVNERKYTPEKAQNISNLAILTLKQRLVKDLAASFARLAVKKLTEGAIRSSGQTDTSGKNNVEKKKVEKSKNQREALALGLQVLNFATEKADTRNWQSLPHSIYYLRIPLEKGKNNITMTLDGLKQKEISFDVNGTGGMQFRNVCTLR